MKIFEPGVYENVPIDDYHASPGISCSGIKLLLDCPLRYRHQYIDKNKKETKPLIKGSATDTLLLEPEKFNKNFRVLSDKERKTEAIKKEEYLKNRKILTYQEYLEITEYVNAVKNSKEYMALKSMPNVTIQTSYAAEFDGVLLRYRPDMVNSMFLIDLKTTQDVSPQKFISSIGAFGYDIQAAIGIDVVTQVTGTCPKGFLILAVEKTAPYVVQLYPIPNEVIEEGREKYKRGIKIYKECMKNGDWPKYFSGPYSKGFTIMPWHSIDSDNYYNLEEIL